MVCEICKEDFSSLDKHHITSKSKEGTNKRYNICHICPNCHRKVHLGDIILEGRFKTTACKVNESELIWRYKNEESITGIEAKVYIIGK